MLLANLVDKLASLEADGIGGDALVVALGDGIPPMSITAVEPEQHGDGDGSTTVWLRVEEM